MTTQKAVTTVSTPPKATPAPVPAPVKTRGEMLREKSMNEILPELAALQKACAAGKITVETSLATSNRLIAGMAAKVQAILDAEAKVKADAEKAQATGRDELATLATSELGKVWTARLAEPMAELTSAVSFTFIVWRNEKGTLDAPIVTVRTAIPVKTPRTPRAPGTGKGGRSVPATEKGVTYRSHTEAYDKVIGGRTTAMSGQTIHDAFKAKGTPLTCTDTTHVS